MSDRPTQFRRGPGGALVCNEPIKGVTQNLSFDDATYYGGSYLIGESMTLGAAKRIAKLLGGTLKGSESEATP